MQRLWAPWRMEYIVQSDKGGCFLCDIFNSAPEQDRAHLLVERGATVAVALNRYPYNNGHVMIAPYRHIDAVELMNTAEMTEMMEQTGRVCRHLKAMMRPDGFNIGINQGAAAGAGLKDHLHLHIVPRWQGDTNFMPVFADVKIIPQALDELWVKLQAALSAAPV